MRNDRPVAGQRRTDGLHEVSGVRAGREDMEGAFEAQEAGVERVILTTLRIRPCKS